MRLRWIWLSVLVGSAVDVITTHLAYLSGRGVEANQHVAVILGTSSEVAYQITGIIVALLVSTVPLLLVRVKQVRPAYLWGLLFAAFGIDRFAAGVNNVVGLYAEYPLGDSGVALFSLILVGAVLVVAGYHWKRIDESWVRV